MAVVGSNCHHLNVNLFLFRWQSFSLHTKRLVIGARSVPRDMKLMAMGGAAPPAGENAGETDGAVGARMDTK